MASLKHWVPIIAVAFLIALGLTVVFGGGLFMMLLTIPIAFVIDQVRSGQPGRLLRSVTRKR